MEILPKTVTFLSVIYHYENATTESMFVELTGYGTLFPTLLLKPSFDFE